MEIARPQIDIESRFKSVKLSSMHESIAGSFTMMVAGVLVRVSVDAAWTSDLEKLCRAYWSSFICSIPNAEPAPQVEIILSPADGECIHQNHPMWNISEPFQQRVVDPTGVWIFHRDFTCLVRGTTYRAWLPRPTESFTDALDNILSVSVRPEAEKRDAFLFHSAIVEHEGRAVVLFGPSGIGKSTAAKMSRENGLRVMASDQGYLRIGADDRLLASASPTRNPDIPRTENEWVTGSLEVKALFALKRTGSFEIAPIDRVEMTRRFFAETFRDETDTDFAPALKFACAVAMLRGVRQAALSYPIGFNFWPRVKELGYI